MMLHRIRDVRKARGLTLDDVAKACDPATTAQTIGRLETGTRTLSLDWLNRIAAALNVESSALVELPDRVDIPVAARLTADGARALTGGASLSAPQPTGGAQAIVVETGIGDYRAGDEIWTETLAAADYARALNRDVLIPRPAGRFLFGRLIGREHGKLHLLPLGAGARQQVVADPAWIAVATRLVRAL